MAGRPAKVNRNVFGKLYLAAVAAGKTTAEFAKEIGMTPQQVSLKASGIRKEAKEQGRQFPYLAKSPVASDDGFAALLDSLDAIPATETETDSESAE